MNRIRLSPDKRFFPAKVGLQRDLSLQPNDRKQSSRHSLMLVIALLAVLRVPQLPCLEINATANRVARAVQLAKGLSRRVTPSVEAAVVSMVVLLAMLVLKVPS